MFLPTENFADIIARATGEAPYGLDMIPTGWTNIVFEGRTPSGTYFFRFPRDPFWAEMMEKDHAFATFIRGRTPFSTPRAALFRDDGRAFSRHGKIEGRSLQSLLPALEPEEFVPVADDIVQFIAALQSIPVEALPPGCSMRASDFLTRLAETHFDRLKGGHLHRLLSAEKAEPCAAHNDFNPGNLIIGDDGRVAGVIDFCFAGVGSRIMDLSRMVGRLPPRLGEILAVRAQKAGLPADREKIAEMIETWNYIEAEYIAYMKAKCPEITLPPGL